MMPLFRMDVVLLQQPVWGKKYMNKKVFLEVDITKFIFLTCLKKMHVNLDANWIITFRECYLYK